MPHCSVPLTKSATKAPPNLPGQWILAIHPVLRRPVWLLRTASELSRTRRNAARPGRLRWLQSVTAAEVRR